MSPRRPAPWRPIVAAVASLSFVTALSACGGSSEPIVEGLDLAVTAVTAPPEAAEGETIEVNAVVENVGVVATTGGTVRFEVGPVGSAGDELARVDLPALAPGETHAITQSITLPASLTSGPTQVAAVVDVAGDGIVDNDTGTALMYVLGSSCAPDAVEDDDDASSATPIALEQTLYGNFCEDGVDWFSFSGVAGVGVAIFLDAPHAGLAFGVLGPDGTTELLIDFEGARPTFVPPSSGTYFIVVQVLPYFDANNQYHNGIGPNTDYQIGLLTPVPDLQGASLWAPTSVAQGGVTTVTADATNGGFTTGGPASFVLFLSADPIITRDDVRIATGTLPALAPYDGDSLDFLVVFPPELIGTYYLGAIVNEDGAVPDLDPSNDFTEVKAIEIVANACTPDAHEADDTPADAVPLALGTTVELNHCEDYYDWVSVELSAGVEYTISMDSVASWTVNPGIQVVDVDGETLLADEPSGQLHFLAPATGVYFINATDTWDMSTRARIGDGLVYTLLVEERLPDLAASGAYLYPKTTVPGGFVEYDYWFQNAGYSIAGPHRVGIYASTDATVTVADRLLTTVDVTELPLAGSGQSNVPLYIPHDLAPGTYSIAAIGDDLGEVIELDESNNVAAPETLTVAPLACALDAYEFDDTLASAKPISLGVAQARNFCDDSTDWVAFTASAGDDVLLHFEQLMIGISGSLEVFDASGASLAGPTPATEDDLFFEAPSTGTYYASVGGNPYDYASSGTAPYEVLVDLCPRDQSEENDWLAAAKTFTVGQTLSLNFCDDYSDWFGFAAVSGTQYVIETGSLGAGIDTTLRLHGPSGTFLVSNDDINGGTKASRITWTAPTSATYFVEVETWFNQWGFDGGYTLSIQ